MEIGERLLRLFIYFASLAPESRNKCNKMAQWLCQAAGDEIKIVYYHCVNHICALHHKLIDNKLTFQLIPWLRRPTLWGPYEYLGIK